MKPLCFVLMPFGKKVDDSGRLIDFDAVYERVIQRACAQADLEPLRADEEVLGGIIHKPMFERLMLCDYAIADLTTANPNVFYELGVRHGIRPHTTVLVFGKGMRLPFDVAPLRGLPYQIDSKGMPEAPDADRDALAERLRLCRNPVEDSPLFQLIADWPRPDIARLKTDTFRQLVEYSNSYKEKLRAARRSGVDAIAAIEGELNIQDADPAIIVDLYLSYRSIKGWEQMVQLVSKMSPILARTVMVREQLGLALNRLGRRDDAEQVLLTLIEERGPSSETNGILGRVYKDRWEETKARGEMTRARGYLRKAVQVYLTGFEADFRDAYPGINAVTLMELDTPIDSRQTEILPVVRYAVRRRLASASSDYWDHASLLELSILSYDEKAAHAALSDALAAVREAWEPETTARNLRLIREARELRGVDYVWIEQIEGDLRKAAESLSDRKET